MTVKVASSPVATPVDVEKWAPLVARTREALGADPMMLVQMMRAHHDRIASAERHKARMAAKAR